MNGTNDSNDKMGLNDKNIIKDKRQQHKDIQRQTNERTDKEYPILLFFCEKVSFPIFIEKISKQIWNFPQNTRQVEHVFLVVVKEKQLRKDINEWERLQPG